jgi:hypothetical protein
MDGTWSMVVESDEVYSPTTKRWYAIESRVTLADGRVKVKAEGVARFWPPQDASKPVRIRRGPTGQAVDVFQIIFSGPTSRRNQ